jgi:carotenoid cleavage dioxygenase-like enzyme
MTTAINPYLSENFAPIHTELTTDELPVVGELPVDLNGLFVRNGPNPQFPPIGPYHWFDGDGMLHGVQIQAGKARYRNRYVQTQGFQRERSAGRALWGGLLQPTPNTNPDSGYKNVANTALVWHNHRLLALWEGGEPHAITVPDLETIGPYRFNDQLTTPFTAHPKVDPVTGEMMFFGYSPVPPYLHYGVVSPQGALQRTLPIELPIGVMMHDFAITEHYSLFLDLPLVFDLSRLQHGEPMLSFERERPSRFGILPRHGNPSDIRWFEAPSCYIFHTLNAYEAGDEVVLVACRMNSTNVLGPSSSPSEHEADHPGLDNDVPLLYRWRFHTKTGAVQEEPLTDRPSEFPRINEQLLGRENRYGYAASAAPGAMPRFDGLVKYDLATGAAQKHEFGAGRYGGEGVFAPRPGATAEDDGWLITYVYDEAQAASELVVVRADDFSAEPVARILLPQRVPYGFHGIWVPASN